MDLYTPAPVPDPFAKPAQPMPPSQRRRGKLRLGSDANRVVARTMLAIRKVRRGDPLTAQDRKALANAQETAARISERMKRKAKFL